MKSYKVFENLVNRYFQLFSHLLIIIFNIIPKTNSCHPNNLRSGNFEFSPVVFNQTIQSAANGFLQQFQIMDILVFSDVGNFYRRIFTTYLPNNKRLLLIQTRYCFDKSRTRIQNAGDNSLRTELSTRGLV